MCQRIELVSQYVAHCDTHSKTRIGQEGVKKCWDSQPAAEAAIDATRLLERRL